MKFRFAADEHSVVHLIDFIDQTDGTWCLCSSECSIANVTWWCFNTASCIACIAVSIRREEGDVNVQ